jgi:hypothetical protein
MSEFNDNHNISFNNSNNISSDSVDHVYDSSDYDSEIDDDSEFIFEPEEQSPTNFTIALCKFIPELSHHLVMTRFKLFNLKFIIEFKNDLNLDDITIEISKCIYLDTQECVAIIKTIWLKLIQRKWKNICAVRKNINSMRILPASIFYRETTGKWPLNCRCIPSLHGMLSDLKH